MERMERVEPIEKLQREYNHDARAFMTKWSEATIPSIVNENYDYYLKQDIQFGTVRQAWATDTVISIFRTHLRRALECERLDDAVIRKMSESLYYNPSIRTMHWASLMVFFFQLGMGYIVQNRVATPGQLTAAIRIFSNQVRNHEIQVIEKARREEEAAKRNDKEEDMTWREYARRTGKPESLLEYIKAEMAAFRRGKGGMFLSEDSR